MTKFVFDPHARPVDSVAGEAGLAPERLQADWLRTRFAGPPAWETESTDEHLLRLALAKDVGVTIGAAVLIPIILRQEGLTLLLTKRTAHLTDHAGQISFPGGRIELTDASARDAALRESEEEVGLARQHVEVLGNLPDYYTGTGYQVTPVVGLVHPPFQLQADANEVAEIFEVPLDFLMNGAHHQRRSIDVPNGIGRRSFYAMPYQQHFIWGATAGMLRNLFHFLRA